MKKAICMLCNNTTYLQAFINNFQYKNKNDFDLILINETRIGNKIDEIKKICNGINNVLIIDGNCIIEKFKKEIIDHKFVNEYTMGLNILQNWYIFKYYNYEKVIVIDDDVLVNNLDKIFAYEKSLFYLFRLSAGSKTYQSNSKQYRLLIKGMSQIFDLEIKSDNYTELWTNNHINAGERLYIKKYFNLEKYEEYLKRFYDNEYIRYLWHIRKKPGSFFLDEWFESFFAYKTGIINDLMKTEKLAYIEIRSEDKIDFNKYEKASKYPIWHNATCSHKNIWLENLKKANKIN